MNELLEGTLIAAERVGGIEVRQPLPADRTKVVFVQRIVIHKRRAAGAAEEFSLERFGQGETGGADRNAREVSERLLANPAIFGNYQVENARGKGLKERQTRRWPQTVL